MEPWSATQRIWLLCGKDRKANNDRVDTPDGSSRVAQGSELLACVSWHPRLVGSDVDILHRDQGRSRLGASLPEFKPGPSLLPALDKDGRLSMGDGEDVVRPPRQGHPGQNLHTAVANQRECLCGRWLCRGAVGVAGLITTLSLQGFAIGHSINAGALPCCLASKRRRPTPARCPSGHLLRCAANAISTRGAGLAHCGIHHPDSA